MHIFPDHFSKAIDLCNTYPACRTLLVSDLELPPIETIPDNDQRGKEIHIIHIMKNKIFDLILNNPYLFRIYKDNITSFFIRC